MARPESIAVAGYYPTPPHLISRIAGLFAPMQASSDSEIHAMDPCAGDGAAVLDLCMALRRPEGAGRCSLYTCELEKQRYEGLKQAVGWADQQRALHGDAFHASFDRAGDKSGVSLLFLNPPYDIDKVHGRLEHRFLDRFTHALMFGGALVYIVPFYSLSASAKHLATHYTDVSCFRFPSEDFAGFKQVVLCAHRVDARIALDPAIESMVLGWASDAASIPELPPDGAESIYDSPVGDAYSGGLKTWAMRAVDITAIAAKARPWMQTTRTGQLVPVPGFTPELPIQDMLLRQYPVATSPRPAHIAAGIASGLFNGSRLEPTDKRSKLPPLLVKGCFDREYKTIEQKVNKDGEVRGLVQVQQPKLVTTVLDLHAYKYHVLKTSTEESQNLDVSSMTVADLIKHYGDSMMAVMERQCPMTYDPRRDASSITLAPSHRKLFAAQSHACKAIVKLLGGTGATQRARKGKAAILLGEIGSGKSTVAAVVGRTIGARRMLVMCPPHLLKGWTDQIGEIFPDAEVRVLATVDDLDKLYEIPPDKTVVAILSREGAKLSHGWGSVGAVCPSCGYLTPNIDLAKKRARCEHETLYPSDDLAKIAVRTALRLSPFDPNDYVIASILQGRSHKARLQAFVDRKDKPAFDRLEAGYLDDALAILAGKYLCDEGERDSVIRAIVMTLLASGDPTLIADTARKVMAKETYYDRLERHLPLLLPPGSPEQEALIVEVTSKREAYSYGDPAGELRKRVEEAKTRDVTISGLKLSWIDGSLTVDGHRHRSLDACRAALHSIARLGRFGKSPACGEFLFQAVPEPRRVALARHIVRYHPALFDFLVLDEGHEYGTDGSAQERSAHRLTSLGIPSLLMTGSIMNGYAESLFMNMWALSPKFREEFERDQRTKFVDRYGYRKRLVEDRDQDGQVVEFGSMSDRVTRSERIIGDAPGILPLFLLRHLLPISVTMHKSDLAIDLPACKQIRHNVQPTPELLERYTKLQKKLVETIRRDQFDKELAGKLWGQLAEIPSYLDRATSDTGNRDDGSYVIEYPESCPSAGKVVAEQRPFAKDTILPKEEWMLDLVESEIAEGRNVMVFSWHVTTLPRVARLIEERVPKKVPILYADKVPTGKRQDWIDREVIRKGARVLVANPVAIQTGLNNLVWFASELWMENPACNPITFRQAMGRVDRIGQKKETRIHFPVYEDTLQEACYDLLMKKVAVSVSTDGLDPESALQAAGVGEDEYVAGLSIGKQLWRMLTEDALRAA